MSTLEVNTINPQSGTTITIGGSGDTVTLGSGATQSGFGGVMTPYFHAYRNDDWNSVPNNTWAKVPINAEEFDSDNCFDSTTNYRFTPTTAGKYWCYGQTRNGVNLTAHYTALYKNGSSVAEGHMDGTVGSEMPISRIISLNGTTDYVELYAYFQGTAGAGQGQFRTYFGAFRIIE